MVVPYAEHITAEAQTLMIAPAKKARSINNTACK